AVFVQQVATGSSVQVMPPGDHDYFGLTFSPDSSYLYAAERVAFRLRKVPSMGGTATTVMEDVRGAVTFAPGAAQFAFSSFDPTWTTLVVASADGTSRRTLVTRPLAEGALNRKASWSPDGRAIATATRAAIIAADAGSGVQRNLAIPGWDAIESVN